VPDISKQVIFNVCGGGLWWFVMLSFVVRVVAVEDRDVRVRVTHKPLPQQFGRGHGWPRDGREKALVMNHKPPIPTVLLDGALWYADPNITTPSRNNILQHCTVSDP
jgi:hypothetical protein